MQRSRQLAVTFESCERLDWEPQIQVFRCLAQHCAQWVILDIRLNPRIVPLLTCLRGQIPCLREICLDWSESELETEPGIQSIDCFETACSLVDFNVEVTTVARYIPILPVHRFFRYISSLAMT